MPYSGSNSPCHWALLIPQLAILDPIQQPRAQGLVLEASQPSVVQRRLYSGRSTIPIAREVSIASMRFCTTAL
jgi:hypothetical protein